MAKRWIPGIVVGSFLMLLWFTVACSPKTAPAPSPTQAAATPASTSGADAEWTKILDAARKEGKVTFYNSQPTELMQQALGKPLAEKYGINMEFIQATSSVSLQRITTEQSSKQYAADLLFGGAGVTDPLQDAGALLAFTPPVVNREPNAWRGNGINSYDNTQQQLTILLSPVGPIVFNTTLVKPGDIPKSYKDLLDPKWKGKIAMADPSALGPGSVTFNLLKRTYGLDYWQKMKGQDITFVRDYGDLARRVAVGENAVALGLSSTHFLTVLKAGAPLKFIEPEEGITPTPVIFNLINGAPHLNAAKVALEYSLTKEGQEGLSSALATWSIRKDVQSRVNPAIDDYVNGARKLVTTDKQFVSEYVADYKNGVPKNALGLK